MIQGLKEIIFLVMGKTQLLKRSFYFCKKMMIVLRGKLKQKKLSTIRKKLLIIKMLWLEIYDQPIMYFPKFFHPDPTVKRQSVS